MDDSEEINFGGIFCTVMKVERGWSWKSDGRRGMSTLGASTIFYFEILKISEIWLCKTLWVYSYRFYEIRMSIHRVLVTSLRNFWFSKPHEFVEGSHRKCEWFSIKKKKMPILNRYFNFNTWNYFILFYFNRWLTLSSFNIITEQLTHSSVYIKS